MFEDVGSMPDMANESCRVIIAVKWLCMLSKHQCISGPNMHRFLYGLYNVHMQTNCLIPATGIQIWAKRIREGEM